MATQRYPVLKEDIFYAKIYNASDFRIKIHNTSTEKDFKANEDTIALLDLCNGINTETEIINALSKQSGESPEVLASSICSILEILQKKKIIAVLERSRESPRKATIIEMRYPLASAQIEITNRCNLSCAHCFNNSGSPRPEELTTEEIFSLLDELNSLGVHKITFSGGEPLLHPDLFEIIAHARKAPMRVDIFTNGTLITTDNVKIFSELSVRRFNISIDSIDESVHDTFRGEKGALKKTLHSINLLRKAGFSVKPVISLSQHNKNCIVHILKYCKSHHIKEFDIIPVRYSGRADRNELKVSADEYYNTLVQVFSYLKEEFPEAVYTIKKTAGEGCSIARSSIGIKSDGTILPCPGCDKEMGLPNVRDVDLKTLWETHPLLEHIRTTTTAHDESCKSCDYCEFCEGCVAGAFSMEGIVKCYYPYLCAQNKAYDEVFGLT